MRKLRLRALVLVIVAMLVITACEVRVGVTPRFPDAVSVSAVTTRTEPVSQGQLSAGASIIYRVRVGSSAAAAGTAFYTEVDTGTSLDMVQYTSGGTAYASSAGPDFFAAGRLAVQDDAALSPQEVITQRVCRGACVIRDAGTGTVYVELKNPTGSSVSYRFFAYVADFEDEHEPNNRRPQDAVPLFDFDSGAIEKLGDVDWFVAERSGEFRFSSQADIFPRAEIRTAEGDPLSPPEILRPGDSREIFTGELIRVYARDHERAASAGRSFYVVEIE